MPLPDKIKNKPLLRVGLDFYWRAFWELSTDRHIGMAEGPIPWTAMNHWALRNGVVGEEFDRFVLLIKAMDVAYLETRNTAQKKRMDKATKGASKGKGSFKPKGGMRTRTK